MNIKDKKNNDYIRQHDFWLDTSKDGDILIEKFLNASKYENNQYVHFLGTHTGKLYDVVKKIYYDASRSSYFDMEVNDIVMDIIEDIYPEVLI